MPQLTQFSLYIEICVVVVVVILFMVFLGWNVNSSVENSGLLFHRKPATAKLCYYPTQRWQLTEFLCSWYVQLKITFTEPLHSATFRSCYDYTECIEAMTMAWAGVIAGTGRLLNPAIMRTKLPFRNFPLLSSQNGLNQWALTDLCYRKGQGGR